MSFLWVAIFLSVGFPFGWNIPSGFGIFPSQFGCSNVSRAACPSDNKNVWGPQGSSRMYETSYSSQYLFTHMPFPFLSMLDLFDLSRLKNEFSSHNLAWSIMPTKISSYMLNFERNMGEDPSMHIITYHLWFSSNSLMDDSIRFHIFHISLTRNATKWYIELKGASFNNCNYLVMDFLTHYRFPI